VRPSPLALHPHIGLVDQHQIMTTHMEQWHKDNYHENTEVQRIKSGMELQPCHEPTLHTHTHIHTNEQPLTVTSCKCQ
jgi:hypothetical protein